MSKLTKTSLAIIFIIIIAVCCGIYFFSYGTPWGMTHAKERLSFLLSQQYSDLPFDIKRVGFNGKSGKYVMFITFRDSPQNEVAFELQSDNQIIHSGGQLEK